ncbi:MAG: serine aminopeptidase domain-containing protein [Planctomycetota bacterium]
MEEPLFFAAERLFGVLHLPEESPRGVGLVFCAPFAEEHKQGYRIFVELARRLQASGFPCLRFDYRGTGDSAGPFTDFTLAGAIEDIGAAAGFLRERAGVERLGLIGLRLGASLAWRAVQDGTDAEALVLWQPIVNGKLFYRLNIQRMLIRQMMTAGTTEGERQTADQATIDLDGFLARRDMCKEIEALDLAAGGSPPAPALLCQFAHTAEPTGELKPMVPNLREGTDEFHPFLIEPFWQRLGYVDCTPAIDATTAWLDARC